MTEMHAACRAAGVNMVLGYEEPQELFLQEVGIQDYRDYEVVGKSQLPGHRPESVFGYLYHEFVPLFQSNPRAESREMTAHCIVTGPDAAPGAALAGGTARISDARRIRGVGRRRAGRMGARAGVEGAEVLRAAASRPEHPAFGREQPACGERLGGRDHAGLAEPADRCRGLARRRKVSAFGLVSHRAAGQNRPPSTSRP